MEDKLIEQISTDLGLIRYVGETDKMYKSRVIYSALGFWCLSLAKTNVSKTGLTSKLNSLVENYKSVFPDIDSYFCSDNVKLIREIYEYLGYLINVEDNRLRLAKYGRGVDFGTCVLYFGLPDRISFVSGLGIFTDDCKNFATLLEVLIRDSLMPSEYVKKCFNEIIFEEGWNKDIQLEYFNPINLKKKNNISSSWSSFPTTELTVSKDKSSSEYYRIICSQEGIIEQYCLEQKDLVSSDKLTGNEHRRLLYALKEYYGNPYTYSIEKLDASHIKLNLYGHLPNREQFFLMLIAWPTGSIEDKNSYVMRAELLPKAEEMLFNIGICKRTQA